MELQRAARFAIPSPAADGASRSLSPACACQSSRLLSPACGALLKRRVRRGPLGAQNPGQFEPSYLMGVLDGSWCGTRDRHREDA